MNRFILIAAGILVVFIRSVFGTDVIVDRNASDEVMPDARTPIVIPGDAVPPPPASTELPVKKPSFIVTHVSSH